MLLLVWDLLIPSANTYLRPGAFPTSRFLEAGDSDLEYGLEEELGESAGEDIYDTADDDDE